MPFVLLAVSFLLTISFVIYRGWWVRVEREEKEIREKVLSAT